jgi:hypothetical protein
MSRLGNWLYKLRSGLPSDPSHPLQIALRTYALSLTFSLAPSLGPLIISRTLKGRLPVKGLRLEGFRRELGVNGFAFAITLAVAGGATLQHFWRTLEEANAQIPGLSQAALSSETNTPARSDVCKRTVQQFKTWTATLDLSPLQKTFISNLLSTSIAIILLQGRNRPRSIPAAGNAPISPTFDLSLVLVVRAADAVIRSLVRKETRMHRPRGDVKAPVDFGQTLASNHSFKETMQKGITEEDAKSNHQCLTTRLDAFVFWFCSARFAPCLSAFQ